jgi:hypothetical protein
MANRAVDAVEIFKSDDSLNETGSAFDRNGSGHSIRSKQETAALAKVCARQALPEPTKMRRLASSDAKITARLFRPKDAGVTPRTYLTKQNCARL